MFAKLSTILCLSLTVLLFSGCETISTDTSGSYKGYKTVSFASAATTGFNPEEAQAVQMIRDAIKSNFESHGIEEVPSGGELLVDYNLIVRDRANMMTAGGAYGTATANEMTMANSQRVEGGSLERGAVIIEIIDIRSGDIIYRNTAIKTLTPYASDNTRRSRINDAVTAALAKFFE